MTEINKTEVSMVMHSVDSYMYERVNAIKLVDLLSKEIENIPECYRESAIFSFSASYDDVDIGLSYFRPETDCEAKVRMDRNNHINKHYEQIELKRLNNLVSKYPEQAQSILKDK